MRLCCCLLPRLRSLSKIGSHNDFVFLADENRIVLYVQAALCAQVAGEWASVKEYGKLAFQTHDLLFGGGVTFFRQRYAKEVDLKLRPGAKALVGSAALNVIWPQ